MDWHFLLRDAAGDINVASQSRIILDSDHTISRLEVFVREVLQNSLDAAIRENGAPRKVTVAFRLHTLTSPQRKQAFMNAVNWSELKCHVLAANSYFQTRREPAVFADPVRLEQQPIRLLEISETNTIGLAGPERITREQDERQWPGELPKAYIALCRDDARREKQSLGSGGTYGLGKGALWAASQVQVVVFFSRLYIPWENPAQRGDVTTHRAAAQARLSTHYFDATSVGFRGLGFGGESRDGYCRPLRNQAAVTLAGQLGLGPRSTENEVGTSILIPFWDQPEPEDDDAPLSLPALLAKYSARFFWPSIEENRLEVTASDESQTVNARDHFVHYDTFIGLYRRVRNGQAEPRDAATERVPFTVPSGPPPLTEPQKQTFIQCAMCEVDPQDSRQAVSEDLLRKVAHIRGQGMVVGYQKVTGNTPVKPFVGLALGGRAADRTDGGFRGDMLLGYSEYVTHTRWDAKSSVLRFWPNSKQRVADVLNRIRDYFERHSRVDVPEAMGDLSPLEEGLRIPGTTGTADEPEPPPGGVPILHKHRFNRAERHYEFEVRANIPRGDRPMHVDVWVEAGLETGSASQGDRFGLQNLRTVPPSLSTEDLGNGKWRIRVPSLERDTSMRIYGRTEDLDIRLFSVTEGQLRAKMTREGEAEEAETKTAVGGEQADA